MRSYLMGYGLVVYDGWGWAGLGRGLVIYDGWGCGFFRPLARTAENTRTGFGCGRYFWFGDRIPHALQLVLGWGFLRLSARRWGTE